MNWTAGGTGRGPIIHIPVPSQGVSGESPGRNGCEEDLGGLEWSWEVLCVGDGHTGGKP